MNDMSKTKRKTESAVDFGSTRLLGQRELELLNYLHLQFPATVGHIPLVGLIHHVYQSGMSDAADIVRERARLLLLNNCKDTVREHYAEQEIRSAAWPNARADLPRIEDVNRESGCDGDNRG